MKVKPITPRGFCPGVVSAISIVQSVIKDPSFPRPITILGMIVHNKFVVEDLTNQGVITLDDPNKSRLELIDEIKSGTVIVTAHGVSDQVLDKLHAKKLTVVDATCKDVRRTHDLVIDHLNEGYEIIYIGKRNHPETEGIVSLSSQVYLVETLEDIDEINIDSKKIFLTNQTTLSIRDILPLTEKILKKYPEVQIADEICDSTRIRQNAILTFNQDVDACFIVGDTRSNNTKNLAKISREETHTLTYQIESVEDITEEMLKGLKVVTVSSGASTPTKKTKEVIQFLESYNEENEIK